MNLHSASVSAAALVGVASSVVRGQDWSFAIVPCSPCQAWGMSADGRTLVGNWPVGMSRAWRWRIGAGGGLDVGLGLGDAAAQAASYDGSVVVGTELGRAFRWNNGVVEYIQADGLPEIAGASWTGEVFVGQVSIAGGSTRAFRGGSAAGFELLDPLPGYTSSTARAVSADGGIVVGYCYGGIGGGRACRWVPPASPQDLGGLAGMNGSRAEGISGDGRVIVGTGFIPGTSTTRAFRWTQEGGMTDLGTLPGTTVSTATGASYTGSVIAGMCGSRPYVWTIESGMRDLAHLLEANGASPAGYSFLSYAEVWVSADGRRFGGQGTDTTALHGWSATVAPYVACYANCDGSSAVPLLNISDFQCFLYRVASADPYANCDQSTTPPVLNINDFVCFLNRFAAGCQ